MNYILCRCFNSKFWYIAFFRWYPSETDKQQCNPNFEKLTMYSKQNLYDWKNHNGFNSPKVIVSDLETCFHCKTMTHIRGEDSSKIRTIPPSQKWNLLILRLTDYDKQNLKPLCNNNYQISKSTYIKS